MLGLSTSAAAVALGLAGGWIAHSLCAPMGTCTAAAATWGGPGLEIGHGLAAGLFALFGWLVAEMTGTTTPVAKRAAERWAAVLMFWFLHSFVTDLALVMGLDYGVPAASGALLPLAFITTVVVAVAWARHDRRTSHA